MAGNKMRKNIRFAFENPAAAAKGEFNMSLEAMQHRLFLLKKAAEAKAAKKANK